MPASLITLPQSAVSSAKNLAVSAGLVAPASSDRLCSRSTTSGLRSSSTVSRLIRCVNVTGVPGGATSANQVLDRYPARPCSSIVGVSGNDGERVAVPTPKILIWPVR